MTGSNKDIVYGINPAFETVLSGRRTVYRAVLSKSAATNPRLKKLEKLCNERNLKVEWLEKGRLIDISGSRENQGVVIETAPYPYADLGEILEAPGKLLLIDNIEDPQNVGAVLRSAQVLGFNDILLPDRGVPGIYPSVVKASAGATEHLRIVRQMNAVKYMQEVVAETGCMTVALDAKGERTLSDCAMMLKEPFMLTIGGEDKGVHQYILNNADVTAYIPQQGSVPSLNASTAAAIAMYALS